MLNDQIPEFNSLENRTESNAASEAGCQGPMHRTKIEYLQYISPRFEEMVHQKRKHRVMQSPQGSRRPMTTRPSAVRFSNNLALGDVDAEGIDQQPDLIQILEQLYNRLQEVSLSFRNGILMKNGFMCAPTSEIYTIAPSPAWYCGQPSDSQTPSKVIIPLK